MNCMKCGRELNGEGVFCGECLAEMEKYPVRPGTVVQLPRRTEAVPGKKAHPRRKPVPTPEERVKSLRRIVRVQAVLLAVTLALAAVLGYFAVQHFLEQDGFLPGQNYSAISESAETPDAD